MSRRTSTTAHGAGSLPQGDQRLAHLHLAERKHPRWTEVLTLRDALRADLDLAAKYAAIKWNAAARFTDDREGYTQAKPDFVERAVLRRTCRVGARA